MEILPIQSNINFQAQKRFLNEFQKNNVQNLVEKMSETLQFKSNDMFFEMTVINRLKIGDKTEFIGANLAQNKNRCFDKIHFTVEEAQLVIDTESGEVEKYKKPFFTRWAKVMKNIDKYLAIFKENFNNSEIVKQEYFRTSGMTPEAFEIFQREIEKLFKERNKK